MRFQGDLYKRARSGEISGFTGVSAPYEPPLKAELSLDTAVLGVDRCVDALLGLLTPKLSSPVAKIGDRRSFKE